MSVFDCCESRSAWPLVLNASSCRCHVLACHGPAGFYGLVGTMDVVDAIRKRGIGDFFRLLTLPAIYFHSREQQALLRWCPFCHRSNVMSASFHRKYCGCVRGLGFRAVAQTAVVELMKALPALKRRRGRARSDDARDRCLLCERFGQNRLLVHVCAVVLIPQS